ncbi:3-hydroxyisobutyryl-CoA hydrolase [Wolfiporia cocos MD-104 SS10]|uniref:3-hydroxyisobutyryl-CoA hydrolase n=1 Tax=Wolfiporia cocos (strain MD-104) TaxID=742152 RepID=A0A2H3JG26_WOLCO|nr:3-hydroxyisobutyryl-CoA hydrolase [Wolfiporia cocos MD-104 SS10]
MSASAKVKTSSDEAPVLFKSDGCLRQYVLNRPLKLNALNEEMLNILRPKIEEWSQGKLPGIIVGTGVGRGFCAGGDVATVVLDAANPDTLPKAVGFFHREFEMDYILAAMPKPYVAVMDGITMGGGVGLAVNAPFRIATENTVFAMPETKIGYCPDVGASYFLPRVDGEIGTYLSLTSETLKGRAVYEHGFATHFVPSRRIPGLLERIASMEDPTGDQLDRLISEHSADQLPQGLDSPLVGATRVALDAAFGHDTVEEILIDLNKIAQDNAKNDDVRAWAKQTFETLHLRSPTSLKVALAAVRRGKSMTLLEALQMEVNIATAFCHGASPDFRTGVDHVLITKVKDQPRPRWSPGSVEEVPAEFIEREFFTNYTPEQSTAPRLQVPEWLAGHTKLISPMQYALPSEEEIRHMVDGSHASSGSTALTLDEVVAKFVALKNGKEGVKEKVLEVVGRRCYEDPDKHTDKKWLKWIH